MCSVRSPRFFFFSFSFRILTDLTYPSVYIAGQVLKRLLQTFTDKVDGQESLASNKATIIYKALEAYSDVYHIVPDKAVRSRMNICFRVTKVWLFISYTSVNCGRL
jgi:phosphoserine aminotransferase